MKRNSVLSLIKGPLSFNPFQLSAFTLQRATWLPGPFFYPNKNLDDFFLQEIGNDFSCSQSQKKPQKGNGMVWFGGNGRMSGGRAKSPFGYFKALVLFDLAAETAAAAASYWKETKQTHAQKHKKHKREKIKTERDSVFTGRSHDGLGWLQLISSLITNDPARAWWFWCKKHFEMTSPEIAVSFFNGSKIYLYSSLSPKFSDYLWFSPDTTRTSNELCSGKVREFEDCRCLSFRSFLHICIFSKILFLLVKKVGLNYLLIILDALGIQSLLGRL